MSGSLYKSKENTENNSVSSQEMYSVYFYYVPCSGLKLSFVFLSSEMWNFIYSVQPAGKVLESADSIFFSPPVLYLL